MEKSNINWRRYRQIRKLRKEEKKESSVDDRSSGSNSILKYVLLFIVTSFIVLLITFSYRPNFATIVLKIISEHTDDHTEHTDDHFDNSIVIRKIRESVLHQDFALSELDHLLEIHKKITSMAIIGPTGTGKTLTASILQQYFTWPENVVHLIWPLESNSLPHASYNSAFWKLTNRGQNLLIVDQIPYGSESRIAIFHQRLLDYLTEQRMKAIILFVFSVPTFLDDQLRHLESNINQVASFNKANGIEPIIFQSITTTQAVRSCVEKAQSDLGLTQLTNAQIEEIVASIDAPRSGCKKVHAKTALYA